MIGAVVVLLVWNVVTVLHLVRWVRKLEDDLTEAWRWVRFYQNLAVTWQARATVGAGLEPYWKWAEDAQEPSSAPSAREGASGNGY